MCVANRRLTSARPAALQSPSTSMHESPARTGGGGGSVILRVKRRREEEVRELKSLSTCSRSRSSACTCVHVTQRLVAIDMRACTHTRTCTRAQPLDALLVAERAKKRGAGQSLQAGLDSLSLAGGETGERAAAEVGGVAAASGANGSSLGTNSPDPARKIFKLLGSSGGGGGGGSSAADVSVCDSPVSKGEGGGIVPFEQPGGAGLESGREAEKVRELIRKMTSDQTCRSLASSAQRQKELACIVDLEFEHGGDGGVKFRSASSVSPSRPSAGGGAGGGSPANPATPAGKGAPESARRDMGAVLCNGSPLIRESLSSTLGDGYGRNGYGLPTDTRNGHSEDMRDEGERYVHVSVCKYTHTHTRTHARTHARTRARAHTHTHTHTDVDLAGVGADSAGAGQKDDEFVYDYYWADPADRADTAAGAGGGWAASAKV